MPTVTELQVKRKSIITESRAILDKADAEKRGMNNEEKLLWDKMMKDEGELDAQIKVLERQEAAERSINESNGRVTTTVISKSKNIDDVALRYGDAGCERRSTEAYEKAFAKYLKSGRSSLNEDEHRSLSADTDSEGGYTTLPLKLAEDIIIAKNNLLFLRNLATKQTITQAQSLGLPYLSADIADSDWTSELLTGSQDTAMAFGRRDLSPNPLAKKIKVSNKLIRISTIDILQLVKQRMSYKFAVTEEKAFLLGTGSGQPLGLFTADANGVPTSRDVATGNTSTAFTFDGLMNAKMSLRAPYRNSKTAGWLLSRDAILRAMKLKDTTNNYLWQISTQEKEPDRLIGNAVYESEYVPNTFTTGLYVGMFGDYSFYYIVDALVTQILKLNELYQETNQIGYIGREEVDAMPVLAEAFARITLA